MKLFPHPSIPNLFLTRDGRVFTEHKATIATSGYAIVYGQRRHVLIAETFIGPRPAGMVVRHKDGNASNDTPSNLCWGTQADNCADTVRHGRSTKGAKNARAKLTTRQVREIKRRLRHGESGQSLAVEFSVSQPTISEINTGKAWSHVK